MTDEVTCDDPQAAHGRYLVIYILGPDPAVLTLCEVEAFPGNTQGSQIYVHSKKRQFECKGPPIIIIIVNIFTW